LIGNAFITFCNSATRLRRKTGSLKSDYVKINTWPQIFAESLNKNTKRKKKKGKKRGEWKWMFKGKSRVLEKSTLEFK
jgi:hypothetical protein